MWETNQEGITQTASVTEVQKGGCLRVLLGQGEEASDGAQELFRFYNGS